jgi:hypothetical protein
MQDGAGGNKQPSPLERLVADHQAEKQAQRKKDSRALAWLALVAVVLVGGGVFAWLRIDPPRHHASARTTLAATASTAASATLADPFLGSPAEGWADGAAGITIPAATAHGPYTAAQVRSAYETTRKLLIAGNLNWPTLRGGPPTAFADLLTAQQRTTFLAGLHTTALAQDGTEQNTRTWVSSFAPGSTQFVTTVIKVHGTMSASATTESGTKVLRITFDYLFVFAVEPPGHPSEWMRIVQQQYGEVDFAQWDDPSGPLEPWIISNGSGTAGVQCGIRDGYIHPAYAQGPSSGPPASGAPQDPYSLATQSAGPANSCTPVTRT